MLQDIHPPFGPQMQSSQRQQLEKYVRPYCTGMAFKLKGLVKNKLFSMGSTPKKLALVPEAEDERFSLASIEQVLIEDKILSPIAKEVPSKNKVFSKLGSFFKSSPLAK